MKDDLIRLKLILDELGIESDISSFSERLTIQKGILLTQSVGVDLGYRFNWYVGGPYSPNLADDYYELDKLKGKVNSEVENYRLNDEVKEKLSPIKDAIESCPKGIAAYRWFELLASIVYLYHRQHDSDAVKNIIRDKKGYLMPYFEQGKDSLIKYGIL